MAKVRIDTLHIPNGSRKDVKKFLRELSALTLKYGIMVEACDPDIVIGRDRPVAELRLIGYGIGKTLSEPIDFLEDHYYERERGSNNPE